MKLQQSLEKHKNEDKPIKHNNRWFFDHKVVGCIRGFSLEDDPFNKSRQRWEVQVVYLDENGKRQTTVWPFKSEGGQGYWDKVFGEALEEADTVDHNWRLGGTIKKFNDKETGTEREVVYYRLEKVDQDESLCPCHAKKELPWTQSNGNGHQEAPVDISEELQAMGFEAPPASDGEKRAIEVLAGALRLAIPANLDTMTSQEAQAWLDNAQKVHIGA